MLKIPRMVEREGHEIHFNEKIYIDVARKLDDDEQSSLHARRSQLDECLTRRKTPAWFRTAKLTVDFRPDGTPREIETSGSSAPGPVLKCLTEIVEGWKIAPIDEQVIRQGVIEWENVYDPDREIAVT